MNCLVFGHYDQDRKVSAKSVTMRAMTLCKNLSGYRELLLKARATELVVIEGHLIRQYDMDEACCPNFIVRKAVSVPGLG